MYLRIIVVTTLFISGIAYAMEESGKSTTCKLTRFGQCLQYYKEIADKKRGVAGATTPAQTFVKLFDVSEDAIKEWEKVQARNTALAREIEGARARGEELETANKAQYGQIEALKTELAKAHDELKEAEDLLKIQRELFAGMRELVAGKQALFACDSSSGY